MFKRNLAKTAAFFALLAIFGFLAGCSDSKDKTKAASKDELDKLVVQFVPTRSGESMETKAKPLEKLLAKELGIPVDISVSTDYSTIIEAMASKKIDVGIMPPNSYVMAHDQNAADAVLQAQIPGVKQPGGESDLENLVDSFRAEIVVKKDSGIKKLEDLKGKRIAAQDVVSASGYVFPVAELMDKGLEADKDFEIVNVKGMDAASMAVLNGDADAAFLFEDGRNLIKKDVPDVFEKLDVLYFTEGRIPNDAIAVRNGLDDAWHKKISEAFIKVSKSPEGKEVISTLFAHQGYVESDDSKYDIIREYGKKVGQN